MDEIFGEGEEKLPSQAFYLDNNGKTLKVVGKLVEVAGKITKV